MRRVAFFKSSVDFQNRAGEMLDRSGALEVVCDQDVVSVDQHGPRVADISGGAVGAQDYLGRGGGVGAFGVENAGADTKGRVAVAVSEKNALVR